VAYVNDTYIDDQSYQAGRQIVQDKADWVSASLLQAHPELDGLGTWLSAELFVQWKMGYNMPAWQELMEFCEQNGLNTPQIEAELKALVDQA
jgi:hypothetical protein